MNELEFLLSVAKDAGGYGGMILGMILAGALFLVALRKRWVVWGKDAGTDCVPDKCRIAENCNKRFDAIEALNIETQEIQRKTGSDISTIKQALYAVFNFIKTKDENLIVPDL